MKRVFVLCLVLLMSGLCSAQSTSNRQAPDGLKIMDARWRYRVSSHRANSQDTSTGANGELMLPDHSRVTQTDGSEAVVTLKNDGPKTIKRVSYFFLFVDPEKGKELLRYQFHHRAAIKPGETVTLTDQIDDPMANRFGPGGTSAWSKVECRLSIYRVEYADGSVWRNPS